MSRNKERSNEPARIPAHTLAAESGSDRFITCLVTPKISFSLPNKGWAHAQDISQSDLRKAFLARFPMEFDVERVVFSPLLSKQPTDQPGLPSRLVFKIGVRNSAGSESLVDDEHVLLSILQSLDKAYAERHQAQLATAKRELLSSCMSFEVMADEIRRAQASAASELSRLKDQASSSQKRLFMLELEKEQLQAARAISEGANEALRQRVDLLAAQNRELREQVGGLTDRLESLTQLVVSASENAAAAASKAEGTAEQAPAPGGGQRSAGAVRTVAAETQTAPPSVDRVVGAMAAWLRQGSQILSSAADEPLLDNEVPVAAPAAAVVVATAAPSARPGAHGASASAGSSAAPTVLPSPGTAPRPITPSAAGSAAKAAAPAPDQPSAAAGAAGAGSGASANVGAAGTPRPKPR